jgi:hypothetical protein
MSLWGRVRPRNSPTADLRHEGVLEEPVEFPLLGIAQGWGRRPVRQEQAEGMLVAALGVLAARYGYDEAA